MSQPSLLVVVQARLSSSRLPGKVLIEVAGRTLLGHLLARVRRSRHAHELVVATTTQPADDRIAAEALRAGARVVRGSESDVLSRFADALAAHPAQVVVRLTADNPLLDPEELDRVIGEFLARRGGPDEVDYATNHTVDGGRPPLGLDVEVCSASALARAAREAREPGDREHVMPYLYRVPGRFRVLRTAYPAPERSRYRLTVDTPEDLLLVRAVLEALGPDAALADIAGYLAARPELAAINAAVVQRGVEGEQASRCRRATGRWLLGRADASATTGYGHAVRLGTLLEAWTEIGGRALLVGHGLHGGSLAARLSAAGVELQRPEGREPRQELAGLLQRARALPAAAIAIDGYGFDPGYQHALAARLPLLALDDLAAQPAVADVIVNQNLDFEGARYGTLQPGQRLLTGAPYVLLRRGLRELLGKPSAAIGREQRRLVIALGGSDPLGLSEPLADAALAVLPDVELTVVVGPGVPSERRERLLALGSRTGRVHAVVDPPELGAVLLGAGALIAAAGVTAWEALALGVPTVLVSVADNQRVVAGPLVARGAALDGGWADAAAPRRAVELARRLLTSPSLGAELASAGRGLIDGRGVWRVIDALLEAIEQREPAWE